VAAFEEGLAPEFPLPCRLGIGVLPSESRCSVGREEAARPGGLLSSRGLVDVRSGARSGRRLDRRRVRAGIIGVAIMIGTGTFGFFHAGTRHDVGRAHGRNAHFNTPCDYYIPCSEYDPRRRA